MEHIRMERDGAVGLITIDRRERFNSLDVETAQDFRKAGLGFARDAERPGGGDPGLRRACSAAGSTSSTSGPAASRAELGYLSPAARQVPPGYGEVFKQILEYIHSTISEIKRAPKPFIAAVDGVAAAGGFGIAMACDLVLASERATFEWAYHKTGLTGAESSTFFLPRLIGLRRSMELVLLNPRLDARAALDAGPHHRGLPDRALRGGGACAMARKLAKGPTRAYGIAKSLLNQAAGVDRLDYHLDHELESLARIADGRDFAEGLEAFLSRRAPRFED